MPERAQLQRIVALAARSAKEAGARAVASGHWLAEVVLDSSAHLPLRDLDTLSAQHHGLQGEALAELLIRNASLTTATVGAAAGALAAASQLTPTTWAALPLELVAETLLVVAIEMKLVAELHTVAGRPIEGGPVQIGPVVAGAWATGRGITAGDLLRANKRDLLGIQARAHVASALRRRLMIRAGRNLSSLIPFLIGAATGAALNRRATRAVGERVAGSLGLASTG